MPDRLARAALGLFALTTVIFWLAAIRGAFDGPTYQWGLFGWGGRGLEGDYWFPAFGAAVALAVIAGGWRSRRWAFALLAAWHVLILTVVLAAVASNPGAARFRGDTLGIDISLVWVGPLLFGAVAVLSLVAAWRAYLQTPVVPGWSVSNSRWLALLVAALPFQFALFHFGGAGSLSDQIGVLITILQWLLVDRIFRPYATSQTDPEAGSTSAASFQ